MGRLLWLITVIFTLNANAVPQAFEDSGGVKITPLIEVPETTAPDMFSDVAAKVDYEKQTIVVTASALNRDHQEDLLFGGNFSPTAAAYLKPLGESRMRAFVQVRCVDKNCDNFAVLIGVRNTMGNPYAHAERKFIIMGPNDYEKAMAGL